MLWGPACGAGARSSDQRPRSSDAVPICHMGAAVLRCASVLAHRISVLAPRTLSRSATWELRSSAALRSSLIGPASSLLGRRPDLPPASCGPPLRFRPRPFAPPELDLLAP